MNALIRHLIQFSAPRRRRLGMPVGVLVVIAMILAPGTALAEYPPGTFPGAGPAGGFPVVVVSQTVCGADLISADYGSAAVTVDVSSDTFDGCTQVTVYGTSGDVISPLLPASESLLLGFAVGWDGPSAADALTLTVQSSSIVVDSIAYVTAGGGLVTAADASIAPGSASIAFADPTGFVLATTGTGAVEGATSPPAPETSTTPDAGDEGSGSMPFILLVVLVVLGLAAIPIWRRRMNRGT